MADSGSFLLIYEPTFRRSSQSADDLAVEMGRSSVRAGGITSYVLGIAPLSRTDEAKDAHGTDMETRAIGLLKGNSTSSTSPCSDSPR